jgi:curli biogenesis system outer membrane secretion channel CsgG
MNPLRLLTTILCISVSSHVFGEVQDIDKELSDLTERLAVPIKDHGKTKVAVIDFTDLEGSSEGELGKYIAEQLTVDFVMTKRDFSVLDRANLNKILAEHKLTSKGLVDPENAKQLGKFAGVDALILGTIIPKGTNTVSLTAKIITTDTAEIIGAARAEFKADATVQQLVSKPVARSNTGGDSGQQQDENAQVVKSFGDLRVELQPLKIVNGSKYLATFTLTNQSTNRSIWVALNAESSALVTDSQGSEYLPVKGTMSGVSVGKLVPSLYQYSAPNQFYPATELTPNNSTTVTLRFASRHINNTAIAGPCNFQIEFLLGREFSNNRAVDVSLPNFATKIDAN